MFNPFLLAIILSATSIVVALAMLFLVLWQAPRRLGNQLMALYMGDVIGWSLSGLAVRLAIMAGQSPVPFFRGVLYGVALNGLLLLALATYFAGLWRYRAVWGMFLVGLVYYLGVLPLLLPGDFASRFAVTPDGAYFYRFDLLGAFNLLLIAAFYGVSLFILWKHRRDKAGGLLPGAAAVTVGVLIGVIPALGPYSLPIIGAALSAILFARAILRQDLFNPLADLNRQLAENERRLRMVITSAPVILFALDKNGVFTMAEGKGLQTLNAKSSDVVGRSVYETNPDLPQVIEAFERARAGEPATSTTEIAGFTFEGRYSPIRNEQGEIVGVIGVSTDITERKQAEASLSQYVSQLEFLERMEVELNQKLSIDYVASMVLDAAIRVTRADAACMGLPEGDGIRIAQVIGHYPDTVVGMYIPPEQGIIGRVVRQRQAELVLNVETDPDYVAVTSYTRAEMVIPLLSQERLVGVINLETESPQRFTSEKFEFLKLLTARIAAAIDNAQLYQQSQAQLAELRALYEKVSAVEQIKTDMIRIAAHDLRNPIGLISGYLHFIHEDMRPHLSPQSEDFFSSIERAVARMETITGDILSLQKIEQAAQGNRREKIALHRMVELAYNDHRDQTEHKGQDYRLELSPEPLVVWGDPTQLQEAIVNLIANAIKYTPDGGSVQVWLRQDDGSALFEVVDTGYGIPEDQQARLFEPFFRAASDETSKIAGTGLGLHLVKNIVERHHGQMCFQSEYGKGSTFGFRLPLWKEGV